MKRLAATERARFPVVRIAIGVAVAVSAAAGVWFIGLDALWATATVLAVGSVGAMVATLRFEENDSWDPPGRDSPRGIRLVIATIEQSLGACDRLSRPTVLRKIRSLVIGERDDRLARSAVARRMRALLVAELHGRGLDAANKSHDAEILALLGPDALTILQPNDHTPVNSAAIARCLDTVERLGTPTQG